MAKKVVKKAAPKNIVEKAKEMILKSSSPKVQSDLSKHSKFDKFKIGDK